MTLTGPEFVRRYLRHVLPSARARFAITASASPAAKAKRQRIQIHTGMPFDLNSGPSPDAAPPGAAPWPRCPTCDQPDALDRIDPATLQDPGPTIAALLLPVHAAATERSTPFCHDIRVRKIHAQRDARPHCLCGSFFAAPTRRTAPFFPDLRGIPGHRNLPNAPMQPRIIRAAPKNPLRRA